VLEMAAQDSAVLAVCKQNIVHESNDMSDDKK